MSDFTERAVQAEKMAIFFGILSVFESGSSTTHLLLTGLGIIALIFTSCIAVCAYNTYLHPLSKFPGPNLWSATYLFRHVANMRGNLDWCLLDFHQRYGPVVRFSPGELSFISERAWKDIYGSQTPPLIKDPSFYNLTGHVALSIFNADEKQHPRMRKQLSHAFSTKALREQEPRVKQHVGLLISELENASHADEPVDMTDWYNFTTFDVVGKLTVGKSFDTLQSPSHRPWINDIWSSIKLAAYIRAMATYTNPQRIVSLVEKCIPRQLIEGRYEYTDYMSAASKERESQGATEETRDFMSYMQKHQGNADGLSDEEIGANCDFLITAGSETTATALSGITWYLLRNPAKLAKLTAEIREAYASEQEMTFMNLATRLPYTLAVIHEGLRLYPSAPTIAPRRTPVGRKTLIDGHVVPGWTSVGVHALSASRSADNFHQPLEFVPERWLSEGLGEKTNDHRGASQPFGFGPRACLGKSLAYDEMRLVLARLFWRYDLELCAESEEWGDHQLTFGLWAKPALMVKLHDIRGSQKT